MIEFFLIALLVAKIKKYRLAPLFREWTTYLFVVFAVFCLYMNISMSQGNTFLFPYTTVLKAIYGVIFAIMILKHSLVKSGFLSAAFAAAGGILNSIVMKANGGKMPVFPSTSYLTGLMKPESFKIMESYDNVHVQGSASTRLAFLADQIDLGYTIMSIGDVLFYSVVFIVIYSMIKHLNSRNMVTPAEEIKEVPQ